MQIQDTPAVVTGAGRGIGRAIALEKVTTIAPGSVNTTFGGRGSAAAAWMIQPEDVASTVVELLRMPDHAHSSRVEMRPAQPPKK